MSILSITFHIEKKAQEKWEIFMKEELPKVISHLHDIDHYIFSVVESDFVEDGKNYNLLLIFKEKKERENFFEKQLEYITDDISSKFERNEVISFCTKLNQIKI